MAVHASESPREGPARPPVERAGATTTITARVLRYNGSGARVVLTGELDVVTAPEVRDALASAFVAGGVDLSVDVGGLDFCDAAGLTVFVEASQRSSAAGGSLRLEHPRPCLSRVIEITDLRSLLAEDPETPPA
jgi:anti-anti-sigma factor